MASRLYNISVNEITLCKSPAVPGANVLIMKNSTDSDNNLSKDIVFKAFNEEKQIAYGYAYIPEVVDYQGDIASNEEVEKAAHGFLENLSKGDATGTGVGYEHQTFPDGCYPCESVIDRDGAIAKSFGVKSEDIHKGGWWIGIKLSDEYWTMAKSGEITGFSIGGTASRIDSKEKSNNSVVDSALNFMTKVLTGKKVRRVNKTDKAASYSDLVNKAMSYNELNTIIEVREALIEKTWTLMDAFWSIMDDDSVVNKVAKVSESINQYLEDIDKLNNIEKSLNKGDSEMTEEQLKKLTKSVELLNKSVTTLVEKLPTEEEVDTKKSKDEKTTDTSATETKKSDNEKTTETKKSKDEKTTDTSATETKKSKDEITDDLAKKVDELAKTVEKLTKNPNTKMSNDIPVDNNGDVKKTLSDSAIGSALSFRI